MRRTLPGQPRRPHALTLRAALIGACILLAPSAGRAAYEQTRWGMSLAEIEKLYPGGTISRDPPPSTSEGYTIERRIAGEHAHIDFVFTPSEGLTNVIVEVNETSDGHGMRDKFAALLTKRYGSRIRGENPDKFSPFVETWCAGDTLILLSSTVDHRFDVPWCKTPGCSKYAQIGYSPKPDYQSTKGL